MASLQCLLCRKEKLASVNFCGTLCKDIYQLIQGKRTRAENDEEEEEEKRIDFTKVLPTEMLEELFYQIRLIDIESMCSVTDAVFDICNNARFQRKYIQRNTYRLEPMLRELIEAGDDSFFGWANIAINMGLFPRTYFAQALQVALTGFVIIQPFMHNAFKTFVPKAIRLGMWNNNVAPEGHLLGIVCAQLWVDGVEVLLGVNLNYPVGFLPSDIRLERLFEDTIDHMLGADYEVDYDERSHLKGIDILNMLLNTGRITLDRDDALTIIQKIIRLGSKYRSVLGNTLDHATSVRARELLGDVNVRLFLLTKAINSREDWIVLEFLKQPDFLNSVDTLIFNLCLLHNVHLSVKYILNHASDLIDMESNWKMYFDRGLKYDNPKVLLQLLRYEKFPKKIDEKTKQEWIHILNNNIRVNPFESKGPAAVKREEKIRLYQNILNEIEKR